jgi:hypothetical protein
MKTTVRLASLVLAAGLMAAPIASVARGPLVGYAVGKAIDNRNAQAQKDGKAQVDGGTKAVAQGVAGGAAGAGVKAAATAAFVSMVGGAEAGAEAGAIGGVIGIVIGAGVGAL